MTPALQTAMEELDELFRQAKEKFDGSRTTQSDLATEEEVVYQCAQVRDMHFASLASSSLSKIFSIDDPIGDSWKGII